jgi:hypothetical protein
MKAPYSTLSDRKDPFQSIREKALLEVADSGSPENKGRPIYTGRYFMVLKRGVTDFTGARKVLKDRVSINSLSIKDVGRLSNTPDDVNALIYEHLWFLV